MKILEKNFLKGIKKARISKEWKQEDIAKKLNVSIPTYSRFERGITKTDYNLMKKVCSLLEIDFYALETENSNIFHEDNTDYETIENIDNETRMEIGAQLKSVIALLEKQQQTNAILLQKLKSLISK